MSGLVTAADLCEPWLGHVRPGWRGPWPCPGDLELVTGPARTVIGLIECTCGCHRGEFTHELPRRADRTGVHPTDVLADG